MVRRFTAVLLASLAVIGVLVLGAARERRGEVREMRNKAGETELRHATEQFYSAVNAMISGDIAPMEAVWSHSPDVTNMGPFGGRQVGWEQVRAEFEHESRMKMAGKVTAQDVIVHAGRDYGYSIAMERGEHFTADNKPVTVDFRGTNIFQREGGKWRMVAHHTDLSPDLQRATGQTAIKGQPVSGGETEERTPATQPQ